MRKHRKKVLNKLARKNVCWGEKGQKADFSNKKGTIIPYSQSPLVLRLKQVVELLMQDEDLIVEGNMYEDHEKNGIGGHGDTERKCVGCQKISYLKDEIPTIQDNREQIISPETAYQIISMMEGVIKRGTGRKLKSLNLNLAGKTGTTNKNMDAWFFGFTSKLVIGVYVGFDVPESLGKYETGAKAALPIFKNFVEKVVKKNDALPFRIPKNINLVLVDVETGLQPNNNTKKVIYESFKQENSFIVGLEKPLNKNKLGLYDSFTKDAILKFY